MNRNAAAEQDIETKALTCGVPQRMIGGLARYILYRIEPGGFLQAVLENDLMEAMGRADVENSFHIGAYAQFIYNHAPNQCHGSKEKVKAWLEAVSE